MLGVKETYIQGSIDALHQHISYLFATAKLSNETDGSTNIHPKDVEFKALK